MAFEKLDHQDTKITKQDIAGSEIVYPLGVLSALVVFQFSQTLISIHRPWAKRAAKIAPRKISSTHSPIHTP